VRAPNRGLHLIDRHGSAAGLAKQSFQVRHVNVARADPDLAIVANDELDGVAGLDPQMFSDLPGKGQLAFARECGRWHSLQMDRFLTKVKEGGSWPTQASAGARLDLFTDDLYSLLMARVQERLATETCSSAAVPRKCDAWSGPPDWRAVVKA
jgi:hypothetical protein